MGFYWIGFIFWSLIVTSVFLLIWGICKKSRKALFISGITLFLPSLYLLGAENWLRALALLPLISFFLAAYYTSKKPSN